MSRDVVVGIDISLHVGKLMNLDQMPVGLKRFSLFFETC
jgi:hypothetical protein